MTVFGGSAAENNKGISNILGIRDKIGSDSEKENEGIPFLCMTSSVSVGFPVPSRDVGRENDFTAFNSEEWAVRVAQSVVRSMFEINISACHLRGRGFDSRSTPFIM
jgi:hypothetical protein